MRWVPFLFLLLLMPSLGHAATINAASCEEGDVQTAVDATSAGDTVVLPACPSGATWTTKVTMPSRDITLQGAGGTSTKLIVGTADGRMLDWQTVSTGGVHRITGIFWDATSVAFCDCKMFYLYGNTAQFRFDHNRVDTQGVEVFRPYGYVRGVLDHNTINLTGSAYLTHAFHTGWNDVYPPDCGVEGCGDGSWTADDTMGLAGNGGALYFEDNTITCTIIASSHCEYVFDGWGGLRIVGRFNTITDVIHGNLHGTESAGRGRGYRHNEFYRERLISTTCDGYGSTPCLGGTGWRGGTGRIFDIAATSSGTGGFHTNQFLTATTLRRICVSDGVNDCLHQFGSCGIYTISAGNLTSSGTRARVTMANHGLSVVGANITGSAVTVSGANQANYNGTFFVVDTDASHNAWFEYECATTCGTSPATGTITYKSPFDENTDSTGYKCLDQAGTGKDDGSFIADGYYITMPNAAWPNQASSPIYSWNNKINGSLQQVDATDYDVIVKDRDYFEDDSTNCAADAGTCSLGVGRGTRAQRPAACVSGAAWWHTDTTINWNTSTTDSQYNPSGNAGEDGGLDICVANAWVDDAYVPYTYPHPLTLAGGSAGLSGTVGLSGSVTIQ